MTHSLTIRLTTLSLAILLAFGMTFSLAYAHEGEDHSVTSSDPKIAQMQKIVSVLTQIVELYKQKAALSGVVVAEADHHDDDAAEDHDEDELKVWVELHSNKTHAHVQKPGMKEQSWLFEDLKYTEEEEIIEAIAEKSGLSEHEIEEVIVFPSGKVDANGDSVEEHDEDADEDVSGIHIMANGIIMWGNGTEVHGATITADDKVKLSDGRIITPKFDLR
jgi:hypothetical protein